MAYSHEYSERLLTRREINDFMHDYDNNLLSDVDFNEEVEIKHHDGSKFILPFALLKEDKIRIYVYTEHCGFFWFHKDDLEEMRVTTSEYNEEEENFDIIEDKITIFNYGV